MSPPISIDPQLTIRKFVDDILPLHRQTSFPVALKGRLHGILSLEDLKSLPQGRWAVTHVQAVMRPVGPGLFVEPSSTLQSALAIMKENGVGSIAVVNAQGQLVGFLRSGKISRRPKVKGNLREGPLSQS
jgi:CBS domain-containing protein